MYKWRYLQFINSDVVLIVIIHETSMFSENNQPYISYTFFDKRTSLCAHERAFLESSEYERIYNMLSFNELVSNILIRIQDVKIQGRIKKTIDDEPTWNILKETQSRNSGKWSVITTQAVFSGIIEYKSVILATEMYVYVDEQFGLIPLYESVREWCWYALMDDNSSKIGFTLKDSNNNCTTYDITKDNTHAVYNVSNTYLYDLATQLQDNNRIEVDALPLWNNRTVRVLKKNPLRYRFREKHFNFFLDYYRYICISGNSICGICEYMKIILPQADKTPKQVKE